MSALPIPQAIGICRCGCGETFERKPRVDGKGFRPRLYYGNHRQPRLKARDPKKYHGNLKLAEPINLDDLPELDIHRIGVAVMADAWKTKKRFLSSRDFLLAADEENKVMLAFWCHVADLSFSKVVARARKEFYGGAGKVAQGVDEVSQVRGPEIPSDGPSRN